MHSTGTIPTEADHNADIDAVNTLRKSQEATNQYQRSKGFAQHDQAAQVSAPQKKPTKPLEGKALRRHVIGSVAGVLRWHFEGSLEVQLPHGTNWVAVKQEKRVTAIATAVTSEIEDRINSREGKIADSPAALKAEVVRQLTTELLDKNHGTLRVMSCSYAAGVYRVAVKSVPKKHMGDGRPAKRIERMKTAIALRQNGNRAA